MSQELIGTKVYSGVVICESDFKIWYMSYFIFLILVTFKIEHWSHDRILTDIFPCSSWSIINVFSIYRLPLTPGPFVFLFESMIYNVVI